MKKSKVLFSSDISSKGLVTIYKKLGVTLEGNVAVKVHSGEPGGNHYLKPDFMKELVSLVEGTIVECNTAYEGRRNTSEKHWEAIKEHGFLDITKVDLLDEDGEIELPITNGKHLKVNYVGKNITKYDSMLVLSHFKGHQMGGYGGALKNISIGLASSYGKAYIHGAGTPENIWTANQDDFLESMAEASSTITSYYKDKIVFINVMRDMSIDCDCNKNPRKPEIEDIGILASTDPVALDKACLDLIYNSKDKGKDSLIKRIEEKHGIHTIEEAERLGVGTTEYELVNID